MNIDILIRNIDTSGNIDKILEILIPMYCGADFQ